VYQEGGYLASASCNRKVLTALSLSSKGNFYLYAVRDRLPDRPLDAPKFTHCLGIDATQIVVMSVSYSGSSPRRYVANTAGSAYNILNGIQYSIHFVSTLFNICIRIAGQKISVEHVGETADLNAERDFTGSLMRQWFGIKTTQTESYTSLAGNVFNSSIAG
jgi:hypothetical protein